MRIKAGFAWKGEIMGEQSEIWKAYKADSDRRKVRAIEEILSQYEEVRFEQRNLSIKPSSITDIAQAIVDYLACNAQADIKKWNTCLVSTQKEATEMWQDNKKELWESIELIWEFVNEYVPLPSQESLLPEPKIYAEELIKALASKFTPPINSLR